MIRAVAISLAILTVAAPDAGAATAGCDDRAPGAGPVTAAPATIQRAPSIQIQNVTAPQMQPTIKLPQPTGKKMAVTQPAPTSGGAGAEAMECAERRIPETLRHKDRQ